MLGVQNGFIHPDHTELSQTMVGRFGEVHVAQTSVGGEKRFHLSARYG